MEKYGHIYFVEVIDQKRISCEQTPVLCNRQKRSQPESRNMRNRNSLNVACWLLPTWSTASPQRDSSPAGSAELQSEFPKLAATFPSEATVGS